MNKIVLRKYRKNDLEDYFELINDEEIKKYIPGVFSNNKEITKSIFNKKLYFDKPNIFIYAIEEQDQNKMIGEVSARIKQQVAEIEIFINSKYRGKGYSISAIKELLDILKEINVNIDKVKALIYKGNDNSTKMFEKLEFQKSKETSIYLEYEKDL